MNYIEKQYEEIFEEALNDSLEKGLISHAEDFPTFIQNHEDISNYYVMDKSVISLMVSKVYTAMTSVYESDKIEYAEGQDLDDLGDKLGILRPQATSAEVECEFTLASILEEDVNVPAGVIVSTSSGVRYETIEPIYIATGYVTTTVMARAVTPGLDSKITAGSLNEVVTQTSYSLSVTNHKNSTGGSETYTDDEYRYFLMNWTKILIKGSLEAYEYYFANVDGVDDYKVIPNWDKTGTMKVIVDPGTSTQLNSIYNDLQKTVSQATEDIVMFAPVAKPIDIYIKVNVDIDQINPYSSLEKEEIESRIKSAILIFIDGGYVYDSESETKVWYNGLGIGEDFIPHKLAVFLDEQISEVKDINFSLPTEYISILDEEIGVSNNVVIEMM
ncbi:baseplate J/gp47 family protein [uncultured Methanobrevibacter sp.]|uniref:baseplate J/gp47 family protein n=1 Tax=uncultured Methanobrevibacter sp. TaxID=253161 RepID=UPI0025F63ADC|nr:baseplate J/gp47 family protein [uncultured Methanobrevibacter sp.]